MPDHPALAIEGLHVTYDSDTDHPVYAVRGVDLHVAPGHSLGIIGESGSGKTTLALTTLMLLPGEAKVEGSVRIGKEGEDVVTATPQQLRSLRWRRAAIVVQAPGRGFNPVRTVGTQIAEPLKLHLDMSGHDARRRTHELAGTVELDPDLLDRYPHQLSGGERQRAMLAMALSCQPDVLILDEPTSGLDSRTRTAILDTINRLRRELHIATLVVSHEIASVAKVADDLAVLYAGMVLEHGPSKTILEDPRQPYTRDLLGAYPTMTTQKDLRGIRGDAPDPTNPPTGCPYHPRCTQAIAECSSWQPQFTKVANRRIVCVRGGVLTRLTATNLAKTYRVDGRHHVQALKNVSLDIREGEVLGIVGETGSGKSTLARLLLGIDPPDEGHIQWEGRPTTTFTNDDWAAFHRDAAIVFQDPFEATSPLFSVADVVREPLDVQRSSTPEQRTDAVRCTLQDVGLPVTDTFLQRRAHELSGGQLQRVAIARALVLGPRLLVADEPTSMLDASEQAKLMVLLKNLQSERGMAMVFVSHDLALVRKVADRILVLHKGEAVEQGPTHRLLTAPTHDVTRQLVEHAPAFFV